MCVSSWFWNKKESSDPFLWTCRFWIPSPQNNALPKWHHLGCIFCHPSLCRIDEMRDTQSTLRGKEELATQFLELSHSLAQMKKIQQLWIICICLHFPQICHLALTEALVNSRFLVFKHFKYLFLLKYQHHFLDCTLGKSWERLRN